MTWFAARLFIGKLAKNPIVRYLAGAIAIVLVLYGIYTKGFWDGEASKDAEYQIVIQEEADRLAGEKAEAERKAAELIQELETTTAERDALLEDIQSQTGDRNRPAVSADSVRQLNRID